MQEIAIQNASTQDIQKRFHTISDTLGTIILGKRSQIEEALCCILAGGHLLIEDIPGVGKTTLAHGLATLLGLDYKRLQFTSDMLPADILGANIYSTQEEKFHFHPGSIFTQVLLADEVNRASPKTQSALLEAMEEQQVSVEGTTHKLPHPFFVIATQNPLEQAGTFPLPESQLDRFLMRIALGFPNREAERSMLQGEDRRSMLRSQEALLKPDELEALQARVPKQFVSDALLNYLLDIIEASRQLAAPGLSPRAGLGLQRAAQAWSLLQGRDSVYPEDVQAVLSSVMVHRIRSAAHGATQQAHDLVQRIIESVSVS